MSDAPGADLILYQTEDGRTRLEDRLEGGIVWLSQALLAELYQTTKQNISLPLKNISADGELVESAVVKDCLTTASDGKRYQTKHDNLDAILAVGCRVRGGAGTSSLHRAMLLSIVRPTHPPRLYSFGSTRNHGGYFFAQACRAVA